MANTMPGIKRSFTLVGFVRNYASTTIAPFVNKESGEQFNSLVCEDAHGQQTLVNVSQNLEELKGKTPEEAAAYIGENKYSLQVVELENGRYSLAKKGHIDTSAGVTLSI